LADDQAQNDGQVKFTQPAQSWMVEVEHKAEFGVAQPWQL